jgi:hypothetical protein
MTTNATNKDQSLVTKPEGFDPEVFKERLMQQVRDAGGAEAFYAKGGGAANIAQNLMKPFYEALLQVEMEQHLGYKKNAVEGRNSGNSRNGAGRKTIRGDFGEVEISTPPAIGREALSLKPSRNVKAGLAISPTRSYPCTRVA